MNSSKTTKPVQARSGPTAMRVQRRVDRVQEAARRGIAGPGQTMPHHADIQRAFGHHDVGGIQAHVGGAAAEASRDMGALAYASGGHVAFRSAPDLHTAAHEAAHIVQQKAGVSLPGGVGAIGDAYERHADRVADLVVQGRSAAGLLDCAPGAAGVGAGVGAGVQLRAVQMDGEVCEEGAAASAEAQSRSDENQSCEPDGKKDEKKDSSVTMEVTPLKIAGVSIALKAGTDGATMEVSKEVELPGGKYPLYPGVYVEWKNKLKLSGSVSLKKNSGGTLDAEGQIGGKIETALLLKGGLPWANVYGGAKLELSLGSKYQNGAFGAVTGGLDGALVVGAELKVPFNEGAEMGDAKGWTKQGGLKFEYAALKGRLCDISITGDGVTVTWTGGNLPLDSLQAAKDEYERNVSGGGGAGAPGYYPGAANGAAGDEPAD